MKDYKNFNISNDQYELLEKLRNEFDIFSDHNSNPNKFIESPEWNRIVEMAGEVLIAFNFQKKLNRIRT